MPDPWMCTASFGHDAQPSNGTPGEAFMCMMRTQEADQGSIASSAPGTLLWRN